MSLYMQVRNQIILLPKRKISKKWRKLTYCRAERMHWVQECIACKVKSVKRGSVKLFKFCNENVFSKTAHEIIYYVLCGYSDALNI